MFLKVGINEHTIVIISEMRSKNTDTDSGWAWFVLVAVYSGTVILSTTVFMGGVIYVALLEDFEGSDAKTSLVGALNGGLLSLLG